MNDNGGAQWTGELKRDALGSIRLVRDADGTAVIVRDTATAAWWLRWLARRLAGREAAALEVLSGVDGVPRLLGFDGRELRRSYIAGQPMHAARPTDAGYYRDARRLLGSMHRSGVAHNDLAKEANWLCTPDGRPAVVDFQLASVRRRRGPVLRMLAREDLRHLLKHKRTYLEARLTARERSMLARPSRAARGWRRAFKPLYVLLTRRLLGWPERRGPAERRH